MLSLEDHDTHWAGLEARGPRGRSQRTTHYISMRDGVRLAADVYVPRDGRARRPTILRLTRYLRRLRPRLGFAPLAAAFDLYARTRRVFLAAGYAWVDVDVRGTGASDGTWLCPWSPDEVRDGAEVVDWIISRSFSDARVGSLGISYDGTSAEMLLANGHPAVRAVAPMFSLFDAFADVAFPGGIPLSWFTRRWAQLNAAFDRNSAADGQAITLYLIGRSGLASTDPTLLERGLSILARDPETQSRARISRMMRGLFEGVALVDGEREPDRSGRVHNMDVHAMAGEVTFRDDLGVSKDLPEGTIDMFSPQAHRSALQASGAAVYSYSGWRDGGYPRAAVERHLTVQTSGSRLTLGPWVHSGKLRIRPFGVAAASAFDHDAELLAFFDEALLGKEPRGDGRPVHYYTHVAGTWRSADRWPPASVTKTLFLGAGRALSASLPPGDGLDVLADSHCGTGERSRWRSLLSLVPGDYPDRRARDEQLLCYDSEPLASELEIAGHPLVVIHASFEHDDGRLFLYLEDLAPDGEVAYVTEGCLRVLHRAVGDPSASPWPQRSYRRAAACPLPAGDIAELVIDLQPIAWLFRRGHRIRLAIAGSDLDHFGPSPAGSLQVHSGASRPSRLELPVVS